MHAAGDTVPGGSSPDGGLALLAIAGLLGFDFIASVVLRIDYEHGLLDAYDSGTFQTPNGTTAIDLRLDDQLPMATLRVGGSTGDDFLVDTGASTTLLLFAHFGRQQSLFDVADDGVGASLAASGIGVAASGIGGRIVIHPVRVKRVRLGATTFGDPLVYRDRSVLPAWALLIGLIGAEILSHYRVFLDYVRYRMLLEPPSNK